jgi:hypothetical protein
LEIEREEKSGKPCILLKKKVYFVDGDGLRIKGRLKKAIFSTMLKKG